MKQNSADASLSISDLKELLKTGQSDTLMKKMSAYCANITGSDAYWYKRRSELEATFEQMKPATAFFTFSYPDNHWDDLHSLIPGPPPKNDVKKRRNVLNNPHLFYWFFGYKLNEFLTQFLIKYSIANGDGIDLNGNQGLPFMHMELLAFKKINEKAYQQENIESHNLFKDLISEGEKAKQKVVEYTDTLISAINPRTDFVENCVPDPHPCSLKTNKIKQEDLPKDYEDVISCCQRHKCRLDGYCKSSLAKNTGKCKFPFPFQLENKTKIEFKETTNTVRAEIVLARNDPYLNMHNPLVCHHWRGNVDMQVILDKSAAINYMVM
ncbi:ATP-dependent DNA helicase PIF1 [Brachionus plicatilis]|uniref:ATP-dependent DNA helicase PIF1 n=1 Tax=Brachionus plicatilis TaxID=10195 RepID=A0A3M7P4T5_BRAPC|nr:ATP-dependent DNA helicase PIF1 [Brachionus plicatilis]